MKKNNSVSFSTPTRQSYAAIVLIMYKLYKVLLRQLFPILILVLIQGKFSKTGALFYMIIVVSIIASVYSIIAFFKYFFYLKGDKLIVQKGVFRRSTLEIPFDRIQSINFEQNLLHRLFNVVKLNMDTAGSSKNELELDALNYGLAKALSEVILRHSKKRAQDHTMVSLEATKKKVIFRLDLWNLIKVGLTINHFRSGGIILFFVLWLFDNLREVGLDLYEKLEAYVPMAEEMSKNVVVVFLFIAVFAVFSLIISMVRVVLKFFDLKMYRKEEGFVVESGLLNRKEYAAKDSKIQIVSWSQNLLQKMIGIFSISLKQASSIEVRKNKSLQVIGLSAQDVENTEKYVFKSDYSELATINFLSVNIYYLLRRLGYWTFVTMLLVFLLQLLKKYDMVLLILWVYVFGMISSYLSYRKKRYGIGDKLICLMGGVFGHSKTTLPLYKLQSIKLLSSPFQRRRNLCSLRMFTASGSMIIPDIATEDAYNLKNTILYKVEKSQKKWM